MKSRRNMSELFRQSKGQLDRRPSPQSWERLEQRLNERRGRHRTHRLRPYLMAAGLLILVSFSLVIALSIRHAPTSDAYYYAAAEAAPQQLEELSSGVLVSEEQSATRAAIVYSNRLHDPSRQISVEEGEAEQKLMVRDR